MLALGAVAAISTSRMGHGARVTPDRALTCGVERWKVKTLQDRPNLLPVKSASISWLRGRTKPSPLPGTRSSFEFRQYRVVARVTHVIPEPDEDIHLVLADSAGRTLIAEAPSASCSMGATAYRRNQMKEARAAVQKCAKAEVIGVAFFDFFHGQTGVAPNEIELHPIVKFRCIP